MPWHATRPSPVRWLSRRFTRYVPASVDTHGSMRSSHRELIARICGSDFVVVASRRAAVVLRLSLARASTVVVTGTNPS
ncbi:hypothetical protein GCM10023214_49280 [Amycolatopsis dongchuanensis]|uniref:Uncharacterized protein n=1 Tax=Amycolatopsis dongchuanensis TaxID=1070866 RepID=A0ABP9R1A4_9PSEU